MTTLLWEFHFVLRVRHPSWFVVCGMISLVYEYSLLSRAGVAGEGAGTYEFYVYAHVRTFCMTAWSLFLNGYGHALF